MIRMKEDVIRHQYIITTDIRDDISAQYNIVICIYGLCICMYKELYRIDIEMVELYEVWESMSSMLLLRGFYFDSIKYPIHTGLV